MNGYCKILYQCPRCGYQDFFVVSTELNCRPLTCFRCKKNFLLGACNSCKDRVECLLKELPAVKYNKDDFYGHLSEKKRTFQVGYSVYVKFKSASERDVMFAFLQENFRDWFVLTGEGPYMSDPTKEPAYRDKSRKPKIGFDYNGHMEHFYAWRVCAWMARMVGQSSFVYDGCEDISLDELGAGIDGWWSIPSALLFEDELYSRQIEIMRNEIIRLTELWKTKKEKEREEK